MLTIYLIWRLILERINEEGQKKIEDLERYWNHEVTQLRATVDQVRDQMEKDAQQKIGNLIQQHRDELSEYVIL